MESSNLHHTKEEGGLHQDRLLHLEPPPRPLTAASKPTNTALRPASCDVSDEHTSIESKGENHVAQVFYITLPLSLVMGIITADMSNLEFLHLIEIKAAVPLQYMTQPSQDILNYNLLRWTFEQSAYLLPLTLFVGAVLILQFVLYVGRLRPARLADGLSLTLVLTGIVVGLTTILSAYVGTYRIGVILTKMLAGVAVCSALGLIAQAVELLPGTSSALDLETESEVRPAAVGFPTVMFATVYGVGSAFASCTIFGGYQIATLLQRHNFTFDGIPSGSTSGFRNLSVLQGLFMLALCVIVGPLLLLSRRLLADIRHCLLNLPLWNLSTRKRQSFPVSKRLSRRQSIFRP